MQMRGFFASLRMTSNGNRNRNGNGNRNRNGNGNGNRNGNRNGGDDKMQTVRLDG